MKPLIGISGRRWKASNLGPRVPRALHDVAVDLHFSDYGRSVALAGGLPVELTREADVNELLDRLDGLILSGGADVEPSRYGALPDPHLGPTEPDRDEWESALYRGARDRGMPVLGICRGFQLINVIEGGTLRQHLDLEDGVGHPQWNVDGHEATHTVRITGGPIMQSLFQGDVAVNSLHHQSVDQLATSLVATAIAPDGVIEGIESPDGRVLGVQWHPELLSAPDPTFTWLVDAAQRRNK
jgi:putative glutamine amidotransferase